MLFLGYNLSKSEHFVFHTVLIVEPNSVHPLRYLATDPSHLSGRPLSPTNHPRPLGSRRPLASCRIAPMWHPSLQILFSSSRRWLPPMFLRRRLASHSLLFPLSLSHFPVIWCCLASPYMLPRRLEGGVSPRLIALKNHDCHASQPPTPCLLCWALVSSSAVDPEVISTPPFSVLTNSRQPRSSKVFIFIFLCKIHLSYKLIFL
jgi:hypothetical protein